jgi:hypothetical protein
MRISSRVWNNYIKRLRMLNTAAAALITDYLSRHDVSTEAGIAELIAYSYAVATKYGEGSAALSAEMYDVIAELSGKYLPPAIPAKTATYGETARAVQGARLFSKDPEVTASAVSRLVKMAGVDTTMENALRDGAEWAWIPSGDTCAFCLTLASRGWQRASKNAIKNGHAEHIHNNCDCTYAIRFNDNTDVEGYDPDKYYEWYKSEPGTPKDKINAMRRDMYAENKDAINAQKRSAYAKRIELNSSAAEETKIK